MAVLILKYGMRGYAFWFRLLEQLGLNEGHFIDLNRPGTFEYFSAYCFGENEFLTLEILETLVNQGAIDRDLWSVKVIWSANFIEGIADAYRNRKVKLPDKPDFLRWKPGLSRVGAVRNPHTKVNDTKEDISPVPAEFEEFWNLYPSRPNSPKGEKQIARQYFMDLKQEEWPDMLKAVKAYAASGTLPVDAERFFWAGRGNKKHEPWRKWVDIGASQQSPAKPIKPENDPLWKMEQERKRLEAMEG
jgi:hypothetical protein